MMKVNHRNLWDRIGLYRWSALLLTVVFIHSVFVRIREEGNIPFTGWTLVFWVGWLILVVAGSWDLVHEFKARRAVKKMISSKLEEGV